MELSKRPNQPKEGCCPPSVYLPPEILIKIFMYLETPLTKCSFTQVNSLWYSVGNEPCLWNTIDLRKFASKCDSEKNFDFKKSIGLTKWFKSVPYYQCITVFGQPRFKKVKSVILPEMSDYHMLHLFFGYTNCEKCKTAIENIVLPAYHTINLCPNFSMITKLKIINSSFKAETIEYISTLANLTKLILRDSRLTTTLINPIFQLTNLQTLKLEDLKVERIEKDIIFLDDDFIEDLKGIEKLTCLKKLSFQNTSIDYWENIFEMDSLTDLNVGGCMLSSDFLSYISYFKKLVRLHCAYSICDDAIMNKDTVPLDTLRYLDFRGNYTPNQNLFQCLMPLISSLDHIILGQNDGINFVFLDTLLSEAKNLQKLELQHCEYLTEPEVQILQLKYLDVKISFT